MKKNVLWISHFVPFPPKGGCFQRSYNLIKEVSRNYDVYLVALKHKDSTHPQSEIEKSKIELEKICKQVFIIDISRNTSGLNLYKLALKSLFSKYPLSVNLFKSNELHRLIQNIVREIKFDIAHYDTISLVEYFDDTGIIPKVLNHHGIESFMMNRRISNEPNPLKKLYFFIEALKLRKYEKNNCHKFDINIVVSEVDKMLLLDISPYSKIEIIENGVDVNYFTPQKNPKKGNSLIFAGRLDQYSNRDGILHFCTRVWPLIIEKIKDLKFTIIGNNPPDRLIEITKCDERIEILGYVDDVRPYFAKSAVCICPIRDGGGTRVKILDALSMAMPIVSTKIGCEGIDVTPEKDILIANTPAEFVEQIARLMRDENLRTYLGNNAIKTAKNKYSWSIIGEKLNKLYKEIININNPRIN